ncbi:class I SAM-dependent methyltransferase [Megasphaera sp.]|uniref:tRNA (adenine(22)-N(1))-methyltransferase n=1 Tax=Megasphaera sp. TaxID=2023260 RepID=UPI001E030036|nr:class I SAM-dependent methyltransferase [Megasphaera sp.]MBS6103748.1 SAM-dependent methyltransferase [Megasphaera sp.]
MQLTPRLEAAVSLIPKGKVIADIGTDHAYIPVHTCETGWCPSAIAADIVPGPLAAAKAHVAGAGLTDRIDCRLGDGLTCIEIGEADGAVICGMGGSLMIKILQQSYDVWQSLKFVVLQPQSDSGDLRRYLYEEGWHIEDERLVIDDGRLYELLRAVPGKAENLPDWQYELGPVNWQRRDGLLGRKIEILMETKGRILAGLQKSRRDMHVHIEALEKELSFWRDLKCQLQ